MYCFIQKGSFIWRLVWIKDNFDIIYYTGGLKEKNLMQQKINTRKNSKTKLVQIRFLTLYCLSRAPEAGTTPPGAAVQLEENNISPLIT